MRIDNPIMPHAGHGNLSLADNAPTFTLGDDQPRVRISQSDFTGASTVDFVLPSGFQFYEIMLREIVPVTGGVDMLLRMSTDGGTSFAAGASDYAYALYGGDTSSSAQNQIDGANSGILLNQTTNGLGTTGTQNYCGRVIIFNAHGNTMFPMILCHSANIGNTGLQTFATSAGNYQTGGAAAINAVRFVLTSGNFERGMGILYGIM